MRYIGCVLAGTLMLVVLPVLMRAQAPVQKAAKPEPSVPQQDVSGVWGATNGGQPVLKFDKVPAMTPEAQTKFDANTEETKRGLPITKDPAFHCLPAGVPHAYQNGAFPFELVQTPKRIFILYESAHNWRQVWMDGRQIPKDGDPTWMGYSVGHWDGNDLIVETGNFNDRTWLDPGGHPHSDSLHVTERFHRPTYGTLQIQVTIEDPKSYTQPWNMTLNYRLRPKWEISESYCLEEDSANFQKTILDPNAK